MGKYIQFGKYNKNYKYIIICTLFSLLAEYFMEFNIFDDKNENENLVVHSIINGIYVHIFIFFLSSILYKSSFENQSITSEEEIKAGKMILNIFIVVIIWELIECIQDLIFNLIIFDYWALGLLMISFVNSKIFKLNVYKHQKIAIIFNSIISIVFQFSYFYIQLQSYEDDHIYIKYKWLIPIIIIMQLFLIFTEVYTITKLKFLMELEYISPHKLLIFYGLIGIIIYFIFCISISFFKCPALLKNYICEVRKNEGDYYIENIFVYLEKFSNLDKIKTVKKLIIIVLGIIFNSLYMYYEVLIINYLSPIHYLFYNSIVRFISDIISLIIDLISNKDSETEIILSIVGNFFCLIGFLIYLEIIELNFCQLNYNIRARIDERGKGDLNDNIICEYEEESDDKILLDSNSSNSELSTKI